MERVGVRELKANASDLLRRVRDEGETIEVTVRGEAVARLVPIAPRTDASDAAAWLADLDTLAARIGEAWQGGSAVEAVGEARREL